MGTLDFSILKIIMSHRRASEAITARRSERLRSEHKLSLREGWGVLGGRVYLRT